MAQDADSADGSSIRTGFDQEFPLSVETDETIC